MPGRIPAGNRCHTPETLIAIGVLKEIYHTLQGNSNPLDTPAFNFEALLNLLNLFPK